MTRQDAARQLAGWLADQHPDLFLAAYHMAVFGKTPNTQGLGDLSDFLGTIGDSVGSAVSSVGDWFSDSANISSLASVASAYLNSQAQRSVLNTQLARVQANQSPLAVSYTTTGVPVIPMTTAGTAVTLNPTATKPQVAGLVPVTQQLLSQLMPSGGWSQYAPWVLGIGGAAVLLLVLRR